MLKNLSEKSDAYYGLNDHYEVFSQAEDYPKYVTDYLLKLTENKIVLDAGCGSGKYISEVEKTAAEIYGIDAAYEQLEIAKNKIKNKENLIEADLINIPFEDNKFDIIYSTWVLGTIIDIERRGKVLEELKRVLKPDGKIILVENNIGGQFEMMRGRYPNSNKTKGYNDWLMSKGFKIFKEINSYFQFKNDDNSKQIFNKIYGDKVAKFATKKIEHRIIMFIYCNKRDS